MIPKYPESSWEVDPKGRVYGLTYSPITRTTIPILFCILCLGSYFSHVKNITILMSLFTFKHFKCKRNAQWQKIYNIGCLGPMVKGWWEVDCWRIWGTFLGDWDVLYFDGGSSDWNTFVKTCQTMYLKWFLIEYNLYLNKVYLNFKIFINNAYMDISEYIGDPLNYLISSILISVWSFCTLVWKIHKINLTFKYFDYKLRSILKC